MLRPIGWDGVSCWALAAQGAVDPKNMDPSARPQPKRDGLTPEQRCFVSYASDHAGDIRPEELRQRVLTDPHAPARSRVIGPLTNLAEFYAAFAVPEGAPMRRPEADRATIW